MTEGKIRNPGEPVDYSPLLNTSVLEDLFVEAASCAGTAAHCRGTIPQWPRRPLQVHGLSQGNSELETQLLDTSLTAIAFSTDLDVDAVAEPHLANILFYIGDANFLWHRAREARDHHAIRFFGDLWDSATLPELIRAMRTGKLGQTACYASTTIRNCAPLAVLYLTDNGMTHCAPKAVLAAFDLHETTGSHPTATTSTGEFKALTYADVLFLRVLFSAQTDLTRDPNELRRFWHQHGPAARDLLDEHLSGD